MENENSMCYKAIRATARRNLSGKWPLSIGVAAIAALLGGLIAGTSFLPDVTKKLEATPGGSIGMDPRLLGVIFGITLGVSIGVFLLSLAIFLISGTIQLGYAQFLLKQHDGREIAFNDLFSQFYRFGQGFAQKFLRGFYVFLWTLLFIIPGIVKSLSYAMTPFIMADHPELSASEAINRSKELMYGHKWDLFVLNLTFIGWGILCILTLNFGFIALNPYMNAAHAVFYRQISSQRRYPEM